MSEIVYTWFIVIKWGSIACEYNPSPSPFYAKNFITGLHVTSNSPSGYVGGQE